jgi:Family of unknown function (DUF6282)
MKNFTWKRGTLGCAALVAITVLGLARIDAGQGAGGARGAGGRGGVPAQGQTASPDDWRIDPMRGPVDLGLTDPSLVGAIDVHQHLDPDAPGAGGQIRALDGFDAAILAKQRGMRGVVFKTHQDPTSAAVAYLVRKHVVPGFEMFGRMALNFSTGGINLAAVEHFSQIKGGWGRIVEMPTRDSCGNGPPNMDPQNLAQNRPWMLLMPPGSSQCVATAKNGELLPEVKYLVGVLAKIRTVDSNGRLVLATGHATAEEHLLLAREGRKQGLQVLLTHPPANAPQVAEAVQLGAFMEMNASGIYKTDAGSKAAAETVKRIGAEHIIVGTDCGQTVNVYPTDCLVLAARGMRAHGVTQRELDLMYKVNPAKLLGLPSLEELGVRPAAASRQ